MQNDKYKIVYFGTAQFAVPTLNRLADQQEVLAVITQPDKKSGRKMQISLNPIKESALELGLPILQPEKVKNNSEFLELLKGLKPDFIIVVAYGQIIPKEILNLPKFACINIHGSILPKYRGASPIQESLLQGDQETGVSFIEMDEGVDTGDIYLSQPFKIDEKDDAIILSEKLSKLGASLINELLNDIAENYIHPIPQGTKHASRCKKIIKEDGLIHWDKENAEKIMNKIRAYAEWPGCFTFLNGKRVKIIEAEIYNGNLSLQPGNVKKLDNNLIVGTMNGQLKLKKLQIEGKKIMTNLEFLHGYGSDIQFTSK